MSTTQSFTNYYLLATVTSSIPAGGNFLPQMKEDMDLLMKNELLPMGRDGALTGGRQVLWEEGIKGRKSSILDILISGSDLTTEDILGIKYIKKKGQALLQGASLLQKLWSGLEWRLNGAFSGPVKKLRRRWELGNNETDTDLEEMNEDSMVDTDTSWSQQLFDAGQKRSNHPIKTSEEKSWEHLLWSIYYAMRNIILEANDESSQQDSLNPLPFNVIPEPQYWSSEFATTPVPDATDLCKPDLVLMDYRLKKNKSGEKTWADVLTNIKITKSELIQGKDIPIFLGVATKGYLIMREQLIANLQLHTHYMDHSGMIISQPLPIGANAVHFVDVLNIITLSDLASLGFDPTIHICTNLCSAGSHNDLPEGIDQMPEGTKGWVMDNNGEVYWIMAILWKSRGLFSRGTVCYRVQDQHRTEFALKNCWVNMENLDHEVTLLWAVDGILNVVSLEKYWGIQYAGQTDCTERIREHISENLLEAPIYSNKVHHHMLLTPCGLPLTTFKSLPELVNVFRDLIVAHKAMVTQWNILHGDLSPNNLIIHNGKGYFIDFDHTKFLKNNAAVNLCGTGTVPYISCRLLKLMGDIPCPSTIDHRASDDLESLFYILLEFTTTYEGPSGKTSAEGVHPVNAPRWRKAYLMMDGDGLGTSGSLKKEFLTEKHPPYKLTPYFKACRPILEEWRKAIGDVLHNERDLSHKEIEILKIMQQDLERILSIPGIPTSQSVAFLPVTSVATPSPTSLPLPTCPHHPIPLPPASLSPPHIEAMAQDAGVWPRCLGQQMQMLPPELPSVTRGTIAHSASGSMTSQVHSSSPPPTSGPMTKETRLRPRRSGQKNKMIPPPLPSLPFVGPNELPGSGAGSMTEELPIHVRYRWSCCTTPKNWQNSNGPNKAKEGIKQSGYKRL
ncbi:uncharacterized protein EDB93DRAFT_1100481 [Suillus bovinus]|uniref:uncharacterized protein n=1 Tax=Suillus bovinus TaxID=48563 RepID=UPI001B86B3D8|nr:uncharacterized protein EDB93DRAFT_1100481 [Suillus bovinus]KAG2158270.1 hypothetical protein EDB93DRAFT_1100481 [Suillus bovinus]